MRRINRVVALGWLAVVGLGAGAFVSSTAFFTDTETVATNSFTTATLDLAASPASAVVSSSNLQPGDEINGTLTLTNSGSVTFRYAMTTSATDPDGKALKDLMTLVIKTSGTSCAAFDGTTLYTGVIASAALGNPAVGQQTLPLRDAIEQRPIGADVGSHGHRRLIRGIREAIQKPVDH